MFQLIFFKQVYIGPKSQVALRVGFWVRLWMFEKKRKLLQYSSYRHLSKLLERKFEPLTQHKRYESMNEFFTFICFKNKMISLWWKQNDPLFKCHVIVNHKRTSCPNYPMAHPTKEKKISCCIGENIARRVSLHAGDAAPHQQPFHRSLVRPHAEISSSTAAASCIK